MTEENNKKRKTAEDFAKLQREISISEFFEKNKHLLGFDNPTKALLIVVKEAVDNSLDACQDAGILPEISVKVKSVGEDRFKVSIEDNGPGIVKEKIPQVFGKLLYGSKFHVLKQNRGQQGIGISACVLYSQMTTGKPTRIFSKIENEKKTNIFDIHIDVQKNEPEIIHEESIDDGIKEHGTRVEMEITGRYRKTQSVDDYLKQTAISNPFAKISYNINGEKMTFNRSVDKLPKEPEEMKRHPYGVEYGMLQRMLKNTNSRTLSSFLQNEFSSVGSKSANEICKIAKLDKNMKPSEIERENIGKLLNAMQKVKLQRPPTDKLSPIGKEELFKGLKKLYPNAEIFTETRSPEVYMGNPFIIEAGIVYDTNLPKEEEVQIIRFANRVPLLYQTSACAIYEAITETRWKNYGLQQVGKGVPIGPCIIVVHVCSAWVPFISESKEAIAAYPEIVKEIKLAIQSCARDMLTFMRRKERSKYETQRLHIFEDYLPIIAENAADLAETKKPDIKKVLQQVVKKELVEDEFRAFESGEIFEKPKKKASSED